MNRSADGSVLRGFRVFLMSVFAAAPLLCGGAGALAAEGQYHAAAQRLADITGGMARISFSKATGAARFVTFKGESPATLRRSGAPDLDAHRLLSRHGDVFGITDVNAQLELVEVRNHREGGVRVMYRQVHDGVPVFASRLMVHYGSNGDLRAMNGTFVPELSLSATPKRSADAAAAVAVRNIQRDFGANDLTIIRSDLQVYRLGLERGVQGPTYLAYEVEVSNFRNVRQFVWVDARTGKEIDRISGVYEVIDRVIYDGPSGGYLSDDPTANVLRKEGDSPTGIDGVDDVYDYTGDSYNLYLNAFGYASFDGEDSPMLSVYDDPRISCPNASWNGTTTNYCTGVSGDDTVAHEWTHAYTEYTHGLIYRWQSGALNEAYSDIFGEVIDMINSGGHSAPKTPRTDGSCAAGGGQPPVTLAATGLADVFAGTAAYGPMVGSVGPIEAAIVLLEDEADPITDGCDAVVNGAELAGKIALIWRGTCTFVTKTAAAEAAGAVAAIIINNQGDSPMGMAGELDTAIPTISVGQAHGQAIQDALDEGEVIGNISAPGSGFDRSVRWLSGEDDPSFGGPIRDMWSPNCFGDPARVNDPFYQCGEDDGGGVHTNSGVPNHAFALLVDGGTFNGYTISPIGLTKAAHIYWIAMSEHQSPASSFADHADALELACDGLQTDGTDLADLIDGAPSGEVVSQADCDQVGAAIDATDLRVPPACPFEPLLDQETPGLSCVADSNLAVEWEQDFESDPSGEWSVVNVPTIELWSGQPLGDAVGYTPVDWKWTDNLPDERDGSAFFAENSAELGGCDPTYGTGDLQSGVMRLTSPQIQLPTATASITLTFDHYVATEADWDGGNIQININDGGWTAIEADSFEFNEYNSVLDVTGNEEEWWESNPLEDEAVFSGTDGGSSKGSWGQSHVAILGYDQAGDITGYANPGDTIQIRFRFGTDGCGGLDGWYVDNVALQNCAPVCGDGEMVGSEVCEGADAGDTAIGCSADCTRLGYCGDGAHQTLFEGCDDGDEDNTDNCLDTCVVADCGDTFTEDGVEDCDDGNIVDDGNGCSATCTRVGTCGDNTVQTLFEECDDNNAADDGNGCSADCMQNNDCGDGVPEDQFEECDDGDADNTDACLDTCMDATCGDGFVQDGVDQCDDGNTTDDDNGCSATCQLDNTCGDGVLEPEAEECDHGADNGSDDGCDANCKRVGSCGDGMVQTSAEECDDNTPEDEGNGCSDTCQRYDVCGDGALQALYEECDDGDIVDTGNGCSDWCEINAVCGDGIVQDFDQDGDGGLAPLEVCDDGGLCADDATYCTDDEDCADVGGSCTVRNDDYCADDCQSEPGYCSDQTIQINEVCDDGNEDDGDGCSADCQSDETCGNGVEDLDEVCDDGNELGGDGCSADCQSLEECGDGELQDAEVCDDGNTRNGDGCSADCQSDESCGNGIRDPGEACDDGNDNSDTLADACRSTCVAASCGDTVVDTGEACDDGNDAADDGCTPTCGFQEVCGNGIIDPGETCDDGNTDNSDDCLSTCQVAGCGDGFVQSGEECDDGNSENSDTCLNTCVSANCGDGFLHVGSEICDGGDGCSATCTVEPGWTCLHGVCVEQPDDGDDTSEDDDDGCSSTGEPAPPVALLLVGLFMGARRQRRASARGR